MTEKLKNDTFASGWKYFWDGLAGDVTLPAVFGFLAALSVFYVFASAIRWAFETLIGLKP